MSKIFFVLSFVGTLLLSFSVRAQNISSPPLKLSVVEEMRLSPEIPKLGTQLRVRNLSSGAQIVLDIASNKTRYHVSALYPLVTTVDQEALLEFSVLRETKVREQITAPSALLNNEDSKLRSVEAMGAHWINLGYRILKTDKGEIFIEVSDRLKTVFISPEQAASRLRVGEERNLGRLFDLSWRAMSIEKYDLAYEGFEKIFQRSRYLNNEQKSQAHLGLATAAYHLQGCGPKVDQNLVEADRDPQNRDDVSYYRALCLMQTQDYRNAEILFRDLAQKRHEGYGEASGFYLGVLAEADERYAEAESAYLDTIDFSPDAALVALAKQRLDHVRELKNLNSYQIKWISGGMSLGLGYDTNVMALPVGMSPATYGLSQQSSQVSNNIAFLSLAPPWSSRWSQTIHYNFMSNLHFDQALSAFYDSNAHDLGSQIQFSTSTSSLHSFGGSWTRVSIGKLGESQEALKTHMAYYQYRKFFGVNAEASSLTNFLDTTVKYTALRPSIPSAIASKNLHANAYALQLKFTRRDVLAHNFGPEGQVEYRPSKGFENSLWDYRFGTFWDYFMNGGQSSWYLSQRLNFSYKSYFESPVGRGDYQLVYLGALGRSWGSYIDTRLQIQGILNVSTRPLDYQYQQASINFLLSMSF